MLDFSLLETALTPLAGDSVFSKGNALAGEFNAFVSGPIASCVALVSAIKILGGGKFTLTACISAIAIAALVYWLVGLGGFITIGKLLSETF